MKDVSFLNLNSVTPTKLRILAAVALLILCGWAVDTGFAINTEHRIAKHVQENSKLETTPKIYVGGMPFLQALWSEEIPHMEVKALDVEVPVLGMVNASTVLRDVTVTPQQALSGDLENAKVSLLTREISIDGVSLGRILGINDLSIANPDDISPGGGLATEAELSGTVPGSTGRSTAVVKLRIKGPKFYMTPTQVTVSPEDKDLSEADVTKAFTYSMDTRQLPLPDQATSVRMSGGSISFDVQRHNIKLSMSSLSPLETEGELGEAFKEKFDFKKKITKDAANPEASQ